MPYLLIGIVSGFVLGTAVVASAQAIPAYKPDAAHAVCWDQPAASVAAASALRVRVTYDAGAATVTPHTCTGAASPYACNLTTPMPLAVQTIGRHTIKVEGATPDIDGTYSAYATLVNFQVDFVNAAQPPQAGSNGRLIKLAQAIARFFSGFWAWLT